MKDNTKGKDKVCTSCEKPVVNINNEYISDAPNDGELTAKTSSAQLSVSGSFTANQSTNSEISVDVKEGYKIPQETEYNTIKNYAETFNANVKIEDGTGSGRNITVFPQYNAIAPDVSASTISGGGNSLQRNMIGYTESVDVIVGDGVNKTFTTTYDTSGATDVDVWLVRADGVLINVTPFSTLTYVGGKTQVLYPKDGHFVNDAGGTNEGTNPAVLPTQKIRLVRKTKNLITGSNSSYCGIHGGYDNLQVGIMNHQMGAHLRITGGNHNTQLGGSYNVIETGTYHVQLGGSGHTISGASGTGVAMLGGGQNTVTGSSGWIIGGQKTLISGARAGALGAWNSTNSGSDATIGGQSITNTGGGSFVFGQNLTNNGAWSDVFGFDNINSGLYSSIHGRNNSNTKDYSLVYGRYCVNRNVGSLVTSGGRISSNGDSQVSSLALKAVTTSGTPVFATGINGDQLVNIAENSSNIILVKAVAIDTDTGDTSCIELKFNIKRLSNITSISGTPTSVKIYNDVDAADWDISPSISPATAMFRISCLGEDDKNIRWTLKVEIIEVSY